MIIPIDEQDSLQLEKITYEYQSSLNILAYLLQQSNINEKYLNDYFKKSELYFIEMKEIENILLEKYTNKKIIFNKQYYFNFQNRYIFIED